MGNVTLLAVRSRRNIDLGVTPGTTTLNRRGKALYRRALNFLMGQASGAVGGDADYTLVTTNTDPAFANACITANTVATSFAATINGVSVSVTPAGGDTASCGLLAAAINASTNALVQGFVTANNLTATATLASVVAGTTIDICGYRFTATTGTPPSIVSGSTYGTFDISGNDTADALALAVAINSMPGLSRWVSAISVAGVVHLLARQFSFSGTTTFAWPSGPHVPSNTLAASAATVTLSGASLAASAKVAINACLPGVAGNAITIATTAGSGTAATLNTEARLTRGTGLNVVSITEGAA